MESARNSGSADARNPAKSVVSPAMMADVEEVEVVVAHNERRDTARR